MSEKPERPKGQDRSDGLLSLEDADWPQRENRYHLAEALHSVALYSNSPAGQRLYARMSAPQPGDWVLETTHFSQSEDTLLKSYGVLVQERMEPIGTPEDGYADRAAYIQYGPAANDVVRWENYQLVAIPQSGKECREWSKR